SLLHYDEASSRFLEPPAGDAAGAASSGGPSLLNQQIGSYTVVGLLGAGGMGEVYRARDNKLGRDVAIKILPSRFTDDAHRRARFAREARLLATINHPNIGAIYGLEETDHLTALVLELVEGPTLADRLARGPMRIPEVLTVARHVAEALRAAHEKGIVHRDLKPANIVLQRSSASAQEACAKVLDFGLAKVEAVPSHGTAPASGDDASGTADGRILGSPAYMSPEQARGEPVDKRTDIWAFGCVLFEMLSGRRPFEGKAVAETLALVLERDPDWLALPSDTPAPLRTLLHRCLRKDPRKRLQDIGDALIEIDDCATGGSQRSHDAPATWIHLTKVGLPWVVAAAVAVVGLVAMRGRSSDPVPRPELVEVAVNAPANSRFTGMEMAVSPDGRHIAFIATSTIGSSLWVRTMSTLEPREIPNTIGARNPFWSPDSRAIGYFQERTLKTVAIENGSPFTVFAGGPVQAVHSRSGGTWSRDGVIVFGPLEDGGLYRISAKGGAATPVTVPEGKARGDRWPSFLDDGQHFLYLAGETDFELRIGSLASTSPEIVGPCESHAVYAAGYLLFVHGGNLVAQRFDANRRNLVGEKIDLGRRTGIEPHNQRGMFAVSAAGALIHRADARAKSQLTWFDRNGIPHGTVGEVGVYFNLGLSPDAQRLAVARMTENGDRSEFDIWTIELSTGNATRLTDDYPGWQFDPTWSPDGKHVAFNEKPSPTQGSFGLSMLSSDGRGETTVLVPAQNTGSPGVTSPDWSPGNIIVYTAGTPLTSDLWTIAMSGDRKPQLFLETKYREGNGTLSPDGQWMAYESNSSGRDEVYVRPFPAKEPWRRISREGGMFPVWRGDTKELFFVALDGSMMAAAFDPRPGAASAAPQKLFATQIRPGNGHPYVVSADGQRFLFPLVREDPRRLILDWRALLPR
ncbi:MAG TPA: protein kinase, partial [Vicinamibacterales bacterium]|nr:protein kinase [Vicinamibacterales bacterium]